MPADPGPEERLSERLSRGAPLAAVVLVVSALALFLIYALLGVLKLVAIALLLALALRTVVRGLEGAKNSHLALGDSLALGYRCVRRRRLVGDGAEPPPGVQATDRRGPGIAPVGGEPVPRSATILGRL